MVRIFPKQNNLQAKEQNHVNAENFKTVLLRLNAQKIVQDYINYVMMILVPTLENVVLYKN